MSVNGERVTRVCKQCNKEFSILKSTLKSNASGNFCCRPCYNEYLKTIKGEKHKDYKRIKTTCDNCKKLISVTPSKLREYKHHFCSKECRGAFYSHENNPYWRGGTKAYRGNFEKVKKEYFNGTNFCALCGTTKDINIHHIIPYRLTKDNSVNNLIPLCRKHHRIVESVSVKFIDTFKGNYEIAKYFLNNILRSRQIETFLLLKELKKANG